MRPSRTATAPPRTIAGSPSAVPRRGAGPARVRSSPAPTTARSASIIRPATWPFSGARLFGGLLHEAETVLDLVLVAVHVEEPQMLLDRGPDALREGVALDAQGLDRSLELARLASGLVEVLGPLDLGLAHDELGLLARLLADLVREPLGGEQRLLEDPLALLEVGHAGLDRGQALAQGVALDDQPLELRGDQVQERADLLRVEPPETVREVVSADINRRDLHRSS